MLLSIMLATAQCIHRIIPSTELLHLLSVGPGTMCEKPNTCQVRECSSTVCRHLTLRRAFMREEMHQSKIYYADLSRQAAGDQSPRRSPRMSRCATRKLTDVKEVEAQDRRLLQRNFVHFCKIDGKSRPGRYYCTMRL